MIDVNHLCPGCMSPWPDPAAPCPHCGYSRQGAAAPGRALPPFTILAGRYLLGTPLGAGGFGVTYLAMDLAQEQRVAIKEFYPQTLAQRRDKQVQALPGEEGRAFREALRSFRQESELMARFRGVPGIVAWRDFVEENGTAYLVMDYLPGETLMRHMRRTGAAFTQGQALALMRPVLLAVDAMHQKQVLHRDVSPENLMLDPAGRQLTLIDFGAARAFDLQGEENLTVILKRGYAPEEQYRSGSRQGPWTDLYACCAVLYQMVSGIRPQDADSRRQKDELTPLDEMDGVSVSHGFARAVEKGLTVHATERYPSIRALLADLEPAAPPPAQETPPEKPPEAPPPPPEPPAAETAPPAPKPAPKEDPKYAKEKPDRHVWVVLAVVAGLLLVLVALVAEVARRSNEARDKPSPTPTPTPAPTEAPAAGWTQELDGALLELMASYGLAADSLEYPQYSDSAEGVMNALQDGLIDCVVGAEVHDAAAAQAEGYYVVAPPAAWQMEDWGYYAILTADPDRYWEITMLLLDEGWYNESDDAAWIEFLESLRDSMDAGGDEFTCNAPDEPTADVMRPYLEYWHDETGGDYTLYYYDEEGAPQPAAESAPAMPELITVTGWIPEGDEEYHTSILYQYSQVEGYLVNAFTGGIFFDEPVTVNYGDASEALGWAVLMTGIIPPEPYEDVAVMRYDDFEPGAHYEVQGFWMDPADYYGQGAWVDQYLFGPTHTNDAGDWYEVFVYAGGPYLFVPVSATRLD